MLGKALFALALVVALVALGISWLAGSDPGAATAAASGEALGTICALTAVLGAGWAQGRGLAGKGALAVVMAGMLFRMLLVSAWAVVAFRVHDLAPIPFLAGFAAVYLPGQAIEVFLLKPRAKNEAAGKK
jgi:hypothetical protein